MQRLLFIAASIFGLLSVIFGAFGAHILKKYIASDLLIVFETGVRYQMYHAFALFVCAWAVTVFKPVLIMRAGGFFTAGILIFSGSLYLLALTGIRMFGAITPIGGVLLMLGWLFLILGARKGK